MCSFSSLILGARDLKPSRGDGSWSNLKPHVTRCDQVWPGHWQLVTNKCNIWHRITIRQGYHLVTGIRWSQLVTGHGWSQVTSGHRSHLVTADSWSQKVPGHSWSLFTSGHWSPLVTHHNWSQVTTRVYSWSQVIPGHILTSHNWSIFMLQESYYSNYTVFIRIPHSPPVSLLQEVPLELLVVDEGTLAHQAHVLLSCKKRGKDWWIGLKFEQLWSDLNLVKFESSELFWSAFHALLLMVFESSVLSWIITLAGLSLLAGLCLPLSPISLEEYEGISNKALLSLQLNSFEVNKQREGQWPQTKAVFTFHICSSILCT